MTCRRTLRVSLLRVGAPTSGRGGRGPAWSPRLPRRTRDRQRPAGVDIRASADRRVAWRQRRNRLPRALTTTVRWRQRPQRPSGPRLPRARGIVHHEVMFRSEATTRGVRVEVLAEYAPDQSHPKDDRWFFLYTITITNEGHDVVQLLSRHWLITNGDGTDQRSARARCRRRTAGARAERIVHVYVRLPPRHVVRHDGGHLPDGHEIRRTI